LCREAGVKRIAFYTPDDVMAPHNSSRQLEASDRIWDCFFTTKSFCVRELESRGVRRAILVGNSFAPEEHYPMSSAEVGSEHEKFDVVLVGTAERERLNSVCALASAGFSVVIHGNGWKGKKLPENITLREAVYSRDYTRALHTGKLALCPLRKLNRDLITQRSVEIPGCGRTMIAERTVEHDAAFERGSEYLGYESDGELVTYVGLLLNDQDRRHRIGVAGRLRAARSGYSTDERAASMYAALRAD
jgi:hypothetical protein